MRLVNFLFISHLFFKGRRYKRMAHHYRSSQSRLMYNRSEHHEDIVKMVKSAKQNKEFKKNLFLVLADLGDTICSENGDEKTQYTAIGIIDNKDIYDILNVHCEKCGDVEGALGRYKRTKRYGYCTCEKCDAELFECVYIKDDPFINSCKKEQ